MTKAFALAYGIKAVVVGYSGDFNDFPFASYECIVLAVGLFVLVFFFFCSLSVWVWAWACGVCTYTNIFYWTFSFIASCFYSIFFSFIAVFSIRLHFLLWIQYMSSTFEFGLFNWFIVTTIFSVEHFNNCNVVV